jgi:uncharacterized membrane protein HdeD (DUF308 family)
MADTAYTAHRSVQTADELSSKARVWYVIGGVAFLILGVIALALPVAATFATNIWLAIVLMVGGAFEIYGAFRRHEGWGLVGEALFGIVAFIAGAVAIIFPLAGILGFTIAFIAFFLASGAARLIQAFRKRHGRYWGLNAISGLISIGLGIFLIVSMPGIAIVTLGILLGIDFAFFGVSLLVTGLTAAKR